MQALFYKGEDITLIFQSVTNLSSFTKVVKFFTPLSAVKTATVTAIDNNSFSAKLAAADTADLTAGTLNIVIEFTASGNKTISKTIECTIADAYLDGGSRPANEVNADIVFVGDIAVDVNFSLNNDVAQQVFQARDQVVANTELLGGIAYNAAAPTPAKSGRYYFTTSGSCSWLTGGAATVAAGDQVVVVYTAPSTYTYTHVPRPDITQEVGIEPGLVMSQDSIYKKLYKDAVKIVPGRNLLNRGYVPGIGEIGGEGWYIFSDGTLNANASWFTTNIIEWELNQEMAIFSHVRSAVQYDINGDVILESVYFPNSQQLDVQIIKHVDAVSFRISFLADISIKAHGNWGEDLYPYEQYVSVINSLKYNGLPVYADENPITKLKRMLITEAFELVNATYTNGVINTPVVIIWADGATGQLTFDKNAAGSITKIYAVHADTHFEMAITRDSSDNVTNTSITF